MAPVPPTILMSELSHWWGSLCWLLIGGENITAQHNEGHITSEWSADYSNVHALPLDIAGRKL